MMFCVFVHKARAMDDDVVYRATPCGLCGGNPWFAPPIQPSRKLRHWRCEKVGERTHAKTCAQRGEMRVSFSEEDRKAPQCPTKMRRGCIGPRRSRRPMA